MDLLQLSYMNFSQPLNHMSYQSNQIGVYEMNLLEQLNHNQLFQHPILAQTGANTNNNKQNLNLLNLLQYQQQSNNLDLCQFLRKSISSQEQLQQQQQQLIFYQNALQNNYSLNVPKNRDEIIRNYINLITNSKTNLDSQQDISNSLYSRLQNEVTQTLIQKNINTYEDLPKQDNNADGVFIESIDQQIQLSKQQIGAIQENISQVRQNISLCLLSTSSATNLILLNQQLLQNQNEYAELIKTLDSLENTKSTFLRFKKTYPNLVMNSVSQPTKNDKKLPLACGKPKKEEELEVEKNDNQDHHNSQQQQYSCGSEMSNNNSSEINDQKNTKKNPFKVIRSKESSLMLLEGIDIPKLKKEQDGITELVPSQIEQTEIKVEKVNESDKNRMGIKQENIDNQEDVIQQERSIDNLKPSEIQQNQQMSDQDCTEHQHIHSSHDASGTTSVEADIDSLNNKRVLKRQKRLQEIVSNIFDKLQDKCCLKVRNLSMELCSKMAAAKDALKNRPFEAIGVATLIHAAYLVGTPITVKKIAKVTESKEKIINKVYTHIKKHVPGFSTQFPPVEEVIQNISKSLNVSQDILKTSMFIYERVEKLKILLNINDTPGNNSTDRVKQSSNLSKHSPLIASACIKLSTYLHDGNLTIQQISDAGRVSDQAVRNVYRILLAHRFELIGDYKISNIDFKRLLNFPNSNLD